MTKQVELPEPVTHWPSVLCERSVPLFTADQMRQFMEDGVRDALQFAIEMYRCGLEDASVYVETHCEDGEFHADQISKSQLPDLRDKK